MENRQRLADRIDWGLLFILVLFFIVSAISISSAQTSGQYATNFVIRQGVWYIVGGVIIACTMYFDPEQYKRMAWYTYGFGILLLLGLIVSPESLVPERNGAHSWYKITESILIQPSEFVKTFLILALARVITNHHEQTPVKTFQTDFKLLVKIGLTTMGPLIFIIADDFGTALVFISIVTGIILVSGITWKLIVPIYGSIAVIGGTVFSLVLFAPNFLEKYLGLHPYQFGRIYSWLDPYNYTREEGFHLIKSLNAVGSGQIYGKGFNGSEVYIPEAHTDFIFSGIAERFGFVGASVVISLFFILIYHLTKTALDTKEPYNAYVCAGVISMITFHVFQNIGMTIQLLPITGIPLPLISYGGSSLMGNMLALGLIFSMKFHHRSYMFSSDNS
ncbi:FtsW/RodA/SpoVE family cell cycle protein [Rossellomorea marisflavi]|uniref:FtsW/RodA/SpoVE family cell cycle protein n=1 Tax=Rossellomorea marisflavi TaxID=189381 RepID=UPI001EE39D11|nr:FtsW/RodA/SpoVE family cell cycle protein [Rossellomorea marisflavi]UKS65610.1 rod shape-determining protein RodA [Rossellomorea marisflavi]